jgi:hypothetical protein
MLWFKQGLDWWRRLDSVRMMWIVMPESAKDRIVGVDTPGNMCHHVSGMERLAD